MVATRGESPLPRNKKEEKRELAKSKILNATLALIAENGLAGLSHRNIASAAGVRLSMTTYYFGTLENLIECAFDEFVVLARPGLDELGRDLDEAYERCDRASGDNSWVYAYIDDIVGLVIDYVEMELNNDQKLLAIECEYLFDHNAPASLSRKIQDYNEDIFNLAQRVCARLNDASPRIDAHLVVAIVRNLEFLISSGRMAFDREFIRELLRRQLRGFVARGS